MTERTYTLDEARALLGQQECATVGHDWEIVATAFGVPVNILCSRCHVAYAIAGQGTHNTLIVHVAREIAERYAGKWHRIYDLPADWFKVTVNEDGTADVVLSIGDEPTEVPS